MLKYKWKVNPKSLPTVLRNCPKCGGRSEFECSRNFRVNANQNRIDVWLIYQCQKCKTSWNMEILSRTDARAIDKELYRKFLENDRELAEYYAFDLSLHQRNRATMEYKDLQYDILGDNISLHDLMEAVQIEIICNYPIDLRLDKLLSRKLMVSREAVKRMVEQQTICVEGYHNWGKEKLRSGTIINILP